VRAVLAAVILLSASGSALGQTTACNPSAPRLDTGAGFVPFGPNEQAHARGGNAGPGWEWALGTDTETGQKSKGSLDWVSGRNYNWTLIYSGAGAATLEVRDAGVLMLSLSYPSGMDAGNVLELQVASNPSIGPDTTMAATVTSLKGQSVLGSITQPGNNLESSQRLYFYYPPMARQGFNVQGTVSLTYKSLPAGSRVDFKLRAGTVPCSNVAPTVSITAPAANALLHAPANISIETSATDSDGTVAQVEFFANGNAIGTAASAPFSLNWTNVAAGGYVVTARATDNAGDQTTSAAVPILVNAPPTVALTSPTTNVFTAPASIPITAQASDSDGTIASVAFYYGETHITTLTSPPYSFTWTAVPQGTYTLTARGTDDRGSTAISAAIPITVSPTAQAVPALYFMHVDHLNTPRLVTDATGTTVWQWVQQEPFGNNVPDENPSGLGVFDLPLRLPGQYVDKETNLYYNYFRDYDSASGRYVQSDPIGLAGGINTFAYVRNNPLRLTDLLGLKGCGSGSTDGATPNLWFGECCDVHDDCYADCRPEALTKEQCDDEFCGCVYRKCTGWANSIACRALAASYCTAVKASETAVRAFNESRKQCVGPQACIPRRRTEG